MRNTLFLYIFIFILLSVGSCDSYPCQKTNLFFSLVGFTDAESDTIILRKFSKGATNAQPVDSVLIDKSITGFSRTHDTLNIAFTRGDIMLVSDYDYHFYFPATGQLISITDINEVQSSRDNELFSCKKPACVNGISDYTQNGQKIGYSGIPIIYLNR